MVGCPSQQRRYLPREASGRPYLNSAAGEAQLAEDGGGRVGREQGAVDVKQQRHRAGRWGNRQRGHGLQAVKWRRWRQAVQAVG